LKKRSRQGGANDDSCARVGERHDERDARAVGAGVLRSYFLVKEARATMEKYFDIVERSSRRFRSSGLWGVSWVFERLPPEPSQAAANPQHPQNLALEPRHTEVSKRMRWKLLVEREGLEPGIAMRGISNLRKRFRRGDSRKRESPSIRHWIWHWRGLSLTSTRARIPRAKSRQNCHRSVEHRPHQPRVDSARQTWVKSRSGAIRCKVLRLGASGRIARYREQNRQHVFVG
jgi:hypothetical protein